MPQNRKGITMKSRSVLGTVLALVSLSVSLIAPSAFAEDPLVEQGVTMRVFEVGALSKVCTLKSGQTPNVDVLRPNINWRSDADFGGYTNDFLVHAVGDIQIPETGVYLFQLTSDDGSKLFIDGKQVISHDGLRGESPPMVGGTLLTAGSHDLKVEYFQAGGGKVLQLSWLRPGQVGFQPVPTSVLTTEGGGARVVAPGPKQCENSNGTESPGDGRPLTDVHPSFSLTDLRPSDDFQPDVSGMSWFPNGDLAVLTWGKRQSSYDGLLYRVRNVQGATSAAQVEYTEIASVMQEPQGVQVVDGDIYVSTKAGLDKLIDTDGDGFFESSARVATWPNGNNFHEFAFGLLYRDGFFYVALSVALERSGDTSPVQRAADRGTVVKINKDTGAMEFIAGGLRTPNGLGWGPDGSMLVSDNQGGWVPSSKIVQIKPGGFYNHPTTSANGPGRYDDEPVTPPVVWMPQNEIGNSPSTPVTLKEGIFAGQLAVGDVTYGGVQRVSLQEVEGQVQGALYRMTQGLEAGVNELSVGPDGDLYVGGIGYDGNWGQPGKLRYGLQKLVANDTVTMDILTTELTETGFKLTYTKPLSEATKQGLASRYRVNQWRYQPTAQYGGPKLDQATLTVESVTVSEDGKTVSLDIPGIREGHVVHIRSPRPFAAADGEPLWSTEVWYTANKLGAYGG